MRGTDRHFAAELRVRGGIALVVTLLLVLAGVGRAQSDDPVRTRIAELEALPTPDADQQAELGELKSAVAFREQAQASAERTKSLKEEAQGAPEQSARLNSELAAVKAALEAPVGLGLLPPPEGASVADLSSALAPVEARLDAEKAKLAAARQVLERRASEEAALAATRKTIPELLAAAERRGQEVRQLLAALPPDADLTALTRAQRENLRAEAEALLARAAELAQDLETTGTTKAGRETLAALLTARAAQARRIVNALESEVDNRREAIAARRLEDAEAARRSAIAEHPVVRAILDENAALAEELTEGIARPRREANEQATEATRLGEELQESFGTIRSQIEKVGLNTVIGLRLRSLHAELLDLRDHAHKAREAREQFEAAHVRSIQLETRRIRDPGAEARRRLDESEAPVPVAEYEKILAAATDGLRAQQKYIDELRKGYIDYAERVLLPLHAAETKLVDLVDRFLVYVEQRWLWIQSTHPVGVADLAELGPSLEWFVDAKHWSEVGRAAVRAVVGRPARAVLWILPFLVLLALRLRLRRSLAASTEQVRRASTDRFAFTFRAAVVTVLLALTWPALLLAGSSLLREGGADSDFVRATADGLERAALWLLMVALVWHLCRPTGLGEGHFKWYADSTRLVRRNLVWLAAVGLPMEFIFVLTRSGGYRTYDDSLGRLAYCISAAAVAVFTWRVMHPDRGILRHVMAERRGGWADRLKPIWFPVLVLSAPAAALAACLGYFLTARALTERIDASIWLILITIVVAALLTRMLAVAQRRLAFEEMLSRLKAEREAAKTEEDGASEEPPPPEDIELDVKEVSEQTRRLVRSAVVVFLVVGLFKVWEGTLPALGIFREMVLWVPSGARAALDAGGAIPVGAVTVADVGLAVIILFVTVVVSRNIPGTLEILVLRHLPMSAGGKYTIRTLVRYLILIVGIFLTFDAIGIGWGKVQWLAAAVSVGLGFGLQEIFANFVSGLIILTERPIRIGDTVTVGTVSGTVTRIQMRATTVTDWDRKELIIPNKSFVTGEITNWTLSQDTLRLTMPVGIAYGSDTVVAKRLLMEVARKDAHVLDNPSPMALFVGFGDSALNLELRVFIDEVERYSRIRDGIYMEIDRVFRDAGIEIAFPQRDLHIRTAAAVPPGVEPEAAS